MRWFVGATLVLAACGGDKTTDGGDECAAWTVTVNVTDPNGDPVEGAAVTLGVSDCTDDGGGTYTCQAIPGDVVLSINKTPDFNVYAETVIVDELVCDQTVDVELPPPLVY